MELGHLGRRGGPISSGSSSQYAVYSIRRRQVRIVLETGTHEYIENVILSPTKGIINSLPIIKRCCPERVTAIIESMMAAIRQDISDGSRFKCNSIEDIGWRNKYNIHLLSGVSQKRLYREGGIIDRMVEAQILQMRKSPSHWGKQTHQYRINLIYLDRVVSEQVLESLIIKGTEE